MAPRHFRREGPKSPKGLATLPLGEFSGSEFFWQLSTNINSSINSSNLPIIYHSHNSQFKSNKFKAKKSNCGRKRLALRSWGEMHKTLGESYGAPSEFRTLPAKCCKMLQFSNCWLAGCDINLASSFVNFWARHSKCGHRSLLQPLKHTKSNTERQTVTQQVVTFHVTKQDCNAKKNLHSLEHLPTCFHLRNEATEESWQHEATTVAIELNCFFEIE